MGLHGAPTQRELEADYRVKGPKYQKLKRWFHQEQGRELLRLAARLGHEWALVQTLGEPELIENLYRFDPLLYHYQRIVGGGDYVLNYDVDDLPGEWTLPLSERIESVQELSRLASLDVDLTVSVDELAEYARWDVQRIQKLKSRADRKKRQLK